jgi:peptidoglycan/LPS O-acetylase OafA/YrhL
MLHTVRERVPINLPAGLAALALALTMMWSGGAQFSALPLSYAAIAIGLQPMPRLKADWSYGVYISAFPMQQWLSNESWGRIWWVNAGLGALWAMTYAAASWRFIEEPALRLKPKVHSWLAAIKRAPATQRTSGAGA